MKSLFHLSLLLHIIVAGIVVGKRFNFFARPKVFLGLYAYIFTFHLVAGLLLAKTGGQFLDPRDEEIEKAKRTPLRSIRVSPYY